MSEPHVAHQVISLEGGFQVVQMDPDGTAHQHMLRSLNDLSVLSEQVGTFQGFESEKVVVEIAIVIDFGVNFVRIFDENVVHLFTEEASWAASHVRIVVEALSHVLDVAEGAVVES